MKRKDFIISALAVVLVLVAGLIVHWRVVRIDLTDDKHYTLGAPTKHLLSELEEPVEVTLYLSGDLNSSFRRLRSATQEMLDEFGVVAPVKWHAYDETKDKLPKDLHPILVHERQKDGKTAQTPVYPYAKVACAGRYVVVSLLNNNRTLSGEENLNISIENLEYTFAEAIHGLRRKDVPKIAFIEGHQELPEAHVADVTAALGNYFQVDRGAMGRRPEELFPYKVLVIADPQQAFSEEDKYCLDQYLMQGGRILWVLNGVQFSGEVLANSGFTPVLPLDLNIADMLFRYGVRVEPALVQDVQCLPIPVDVSTDKEVPNFQPVPWHYAPLLLTSQQSPVTRNVTQVSCSFASPLEPVGGEDGIRKEVLLATSTSSRIIPTPAEVDLGDLNPDISTFKYQYLPVAVALQGKFGSIFAHRMKPDSIQTDLPIRSVSVETKQIVVSSGSIIRNEVEKGEVLPVGYDRYSGMQFGNRDFLVNAVLYLSDDEGLIGLRQKQVDLHLLNTKRAYEKRTSIQLASTMIPLAVLAVIALGVWVVRKRKYTR
jgi:ABC-2 type transport system permease protein